MICWLKQKQYLWRQHLSVKFRLWNVLRAGWVRLLSFLRGATILIRGTFIRNVYIKVYMYTLQTPAYTAHNFWTHTLIWCLSLTSPLVASLSRASERVDALFRCLFVLQQAVWVLLTLILIKITNCDGVHLAAPSMRSQRASWTWARGRRRVTSALTWAPAHREVR